MGKSKRIRDKRLRCIPSHMPAVRDAMVEGLFFCADSRQRESRIISLDTRLNYMGRAVTADDALRWWRRARG